MMPAPRDSEKKVNPMAFRIVAPLTCSQLNENRNCMPSQEPGIIKDRMMMKIIRINKSGIRYLAIFSIPFSTPKATTAQVAVRYRNMKKTFTVDNIAGKRIK